MGTKIRGAGSESGQTPVRGDKAGNTESESTKDTRAGAGGAGAGTGAGSRESTASEEEKLPRLAPVDREEEKRLARNAKRRERYAAKKASAPKKVTPKGKGKDADTSQCEAVIMTLSSIIASREGCAHWQLTPDETKALAQPIANMMAKSEALGQINEHSDAVALATAAFTIMMPRIILTSNIRKEKKKNDRKITGNLGTGAGGKQAVQNSGVDGNSGGQPARSIGDDGKIQPEFGNALCG